MRKLRRSATYANVCSTLALVIAVSGGTAWAASRIGSRQLASGAVVSRVLATGSVTSRAVKNHSLLAVDFKRGQLPAGPRGPVGPAGAGSVTAAIWSDVTGVNGLTTTAFTLARTIATITLPAGVPVLDVRVTSSLAATAVGSGGTCFAQVRVDGRATTGTAPTGGSPMPGGTAMLPVAPSSSATASLSLEGWFRGVASGRHTIELWLDSTSAGTACSEPIDVTPHGEAYVTALH